MIIQSKKSISARLPKRRRAFSLLELTTVVLLIGLIASMAINRFGHDTISVTEAEGFARRLNMAFKVAQKISIMEGAEGTLQFDRSSGTVTAFRILRSTSGGDVLYDTIVQVPEGVSVTAPADRWQFNFSGAITTPESGGTVTIQAPGWRWDLQLFATTGHCRMTRSAL